MLTDYIVIGEVVTPHGVRGDVRVIPLTDFPERFNELKRIYLDNGTELQVEKVTFHKQFVLLKFHNYNNRNEVEALRGQLIRIPKEEAVTLPQDHYFVFDIIGLKVFDENGTNLGVVTDVLQTGSNDVYVVEAEGSNQPLLIPALKKVVLAIDIPNSKLIVKLQEEW